MLGYLLFAVSDKNVISLLIACLVVAKKNDGLSSFFSQNNSVLTNEIFYAF